MKKTLVVAGLAVLLMTPSMVRAEEPSLSNVQRQKTIERLNLTEEQRLLVEPILRESKEKRAALFQSVGIKDGDKLKLRKVLKVRKPLKALQQETQSRLAAILNQPQMNEYLLIVGEARKKILASLK